MTTGLLGPNGRPIASSEFRKTKDQPILGEAFGVWGPNADIRYANLPGIGIVQFDLSKLTLADYKVMRDHYQVNASLNVLSFMQHQSDWHIECENQKIADECERQLRNIWTQLNRAMSVANWSGYSPNILQWENNDITSRTELSKVKDLDPASCAVNWKEIDGWVPPGSNAKNKLKVYDGIKQIGAPWPIPSDNSFWYPMLMENNDYMGRKLLRPAFTSWFFSILIHMFANRYFERYGEPVVKGRAPFENDVQLPDGTKLNGLEYMISVMKDLRNRAVIALPDDKTEMSNGRMEFDYDISYLESQMRGADWERYLTRLDEEISIGLFTPILLLRTADVGSYNLGVGHMQMYLWMLNAMNDDRAQYINKYILSRMTDFNFSVKAPRPRIVFRKLGNQNADVLVQVMKYLTQGGRISFDYKELGEIVGMTITEVKQTIEDTSGDSNNPDDPSNEEDNSSVSDGADE